MNKKHSKAYRALKEKVIAESYSVNDAVKFLIDNKTGKIDPTIELHLKLNLKKGKEKTTFRIMITPPTPIAKLPQIAVLAKNFKSTDKNVNVDSEKILTKIKKSKVDFDILLATPDYIDKLKPYAKFLGPKGLMPTEKNETLTNKPEKIISNLLKGQKTLIADDGDNLHIPCGKLSIGADKILENINYILEEIKNHKPAGVKGDFILNAKLCTTHSPSLKLEF